ncbi:hypothetical protein TIFTF001_019673 [Ficus carica]|uniref:Regulator of Vps4 activity in the MVB pathway protein n=1 Tax=Ficus carica TaxID=3494 RepID=A0AA88DBZ2_FICCA|nr:hypothetical protein TIFTF001_019673 [Ficus carica]
MRLSHFEAFEFWRKRNATQKFLRKDVVDLLANGLDINAYGRAEGLLAELILSSCYDFVEGCCDVVLKHLSVMQKQSECPEECKAAVASLMFAAARFSDLPELRDLRHMFCERYGDTLQVFENKEFKENLGSKPSTLENKVRLMKEIASEFSIKWDSKAFEQRMNKPPASPQALPKVHAPYHLGADNSDSYNGKDKCLKGDSHGILFKERFDLNNGRGVPRNEKDGSVSKMDAVDFQTRHAFAQNGSNSLYGREETNLKKDKKDGPVAKMDVVDFQTRHAFPQNGNNSLYGREETTLKKDRKDSHDSLFQGRREFAPDRHALNAKEDSTPRTVGVGSSSQRNRLESADVGSKLHYGRANSIPIIDSQDALPYARPDMSAPHGKSNGKEKFSGDNLDGQHITAYSSSKDEVEAKSKSYYVNAIPLYGQNITANSSSKDEVEPKSKPYYANAIPPPYVKRNTKEKVRKQVAHLGSSDDDFDGNGVIKDSSTRDRANAGHISEGVHQGSDRSRHEKHLVEPERLDIHYREKDQIYQDDVTGNPIPKPRSMRRKHSKSRSFQIDAGDFKEAGVLPRKSRSKRRDDSRRGLQILFDEEHHQKDEEERIIDKLLFHYSQKPSVYEPGKPRRKSKSRHAHHGVNDESPRNGSRDGSDKESQLTPLPARSVSPLPHGHAGPSAATKVFTRAASFQPERSDGARHVHPKLPDYDDLAARFAALRGR